MKEKVLIAGDVAGVVYRIPSGQRRVVLMPIKAKYVGSFQFTPFFFNGTYDTGTFFSASSGFDILVDNNYKQLTDVDSMVNVKAR